MLLESHMKKRLWESFEFMTSQNFRYRKIKKTKLPLISVVINRLGKKFSTEALIDSGAAVSVLKTEIADALGLPLRGNRKIITGIGGKETVGYLFNLDCDLMDKSHKFDFHIPIKKSDTPYTILGRDSIFEEYEIKFRQKENTFVLSDY